MLLWLLIFITVNPVIATDRPLYRMDEGENYTKLSQDFDQKMQLMNKNKDQDLQYVGVLLWLSHALQQHFNFIPDYSGKQLTARSLEIILKGCEVWGDKVDGENPYILTDSEGMAKLKEKTNDQTKIWLGQLYQGLLLQMGVNRQRITKLIEHASDIMKDEEMEHLTGEIVQKYLSILGVWLYTLEREESGPYRLVNTAIQLDTTERLKDIEAEFGMILLGLSHLYLKYRSEFGIPPATSKLYRGMCFLSDQQWGDLDRLYNTGDSFSFPQFYSVTTELEIAKKFMREDFEHDTHPAPKSVLFEITNFSDLVGVNVAKVSACEEEAEILIFPYQEFIVKGYREEEGYGRGVVELEWKQNESRRYPTAEIDYTELLWDMLSESRWRIELLATEKAKEQFQSFGLSENQYMQIVQALVMMKQMIAPDKETLRRFVNALQTGDKQTAEFQNLKMMVDLFHMQTKKRKL